MIRKSPSDEQATLKISFAHLHMCHYHITFTIITVSENCSFGNHRWYDLATYLVDADVLDNYFISNIANVSSISHITCDVISLLQINVYVNFETTDDDLPKVAEVDSRLLMITDEFFLNRRCRDFENRPWSGFPKVSSDGIFKVADEGYSQIFKIASKKRGKKGEKIFETVDEGEIHVEMAAEVNCRPNKRALTRFNGLCGHAIQHRKLSGLESARDVFERTVQIALESPMWRGRVERPPPTSHQEACRSPPPCLSLSPPNPSFRPHGLIHWADTMDKCARF